MSDIFLFILGGFASFGDRSESGFVGSTQHLPLALREWNAAVPWRAACAVVDARSVLLRVLLKR